MALLIPFDSGGLDPRVSFALDDIIAAIQVWAGKVDGINAAERLNELTSGIASLPTLDSGDIIATGRSTARTGFLMCDGSAVSRTTYANLFNAIGTAYGAGDGTNTFNVPNLRQRFPLGKAASGTGSTLGSTGGAIDHTHTGPSHTHTLSGSTASEAAHTHSVSGVTDVTTISVGQPSATTVVQSGTGVSVASSTHTHDDGGSGHGHNFSATSGAGSAHSHGVGTLATGAGGTGNTGTANPPYQVVNYMIKT